MVGLLMTAMLSQHLCTASHILRIYDSLFVSGRIGSPILAFMFWTLVRSQGIRCMNSVVLRDASSWFQEACISIVRKSACLIQNPTDSNGEAILIGSRNGYMTSYCDL